MAGTFTFLGAHFVFSTKNRMPWIDEEIKKRLCSYIGGIIREIGGVLFEINAVEDHIHFYALTPKTLAVSDFMRIVKGNSSKWVHETFAEKKEFAWQDGYGAFAVCKSMEGKIVEYIRNQPDHHRKKSFYEEFREVLNRHGIEYDERYSWA